MDILSYQERFVDKRNDELIRKLIINTENYKSDTNNNASVKHVLDELSQYIKNYHSLEKSTDQ